MASKLLHAIVAVLTVLLYLVRQKYVYAGVCPAKRHLVKSTSCGRDDSSETPKSQSSFSAMMYTCNIWTRGNKSVCSQPKCKRDPEISIDNEDIGKYPYD